MKFSEILNTKNISFQNAFLLGSIYSWPILTEESNYILAYSTYRLGSRSISAVSKSIDEYFRLHLEKLKIFLGNDFVIDLNSNLRKKFKFTDKVLDGVSVLVDFDLEIPKNLERDKYIYGVIEKWLIDVEDKYKETFLVGVMDGRGSLDFTARYFSIDIARNSQPDIVRRKLNKYNDIIGAIFNYNPRLTQGDSSSKNDQFRLALDYYIGNFGLFTPYKIDYYKAEKIFSSSEEWKYNFFFIDSKYKSLSINNQNISNRNLAINELAIKLKKDGLSKEDQKLIIDTYKEENLSLDTEDELLYSSQNMKEQSKVIANYICEFSNKHKTFTAKSVGREYVEAHHLIPFSKRNNFPVSIDVIENIVCLCPNCHRKIHLAIDEEKLELINPLFLKKENQWVAVGINITKEMLLSFYKIGVAKE